MTKRWMGMKPVNCEVCGNRLKGVFYDAQINAGGWVLICGVCFIKHGVGLGVGKGQMYNIVTLEKLYG